MILVRRCGMVRQLVMGVIDDVGIQGLIVVAVVSSIGIRSGGGGHPESFSSSRGCKIR